MLARPLTENRKLAKLWKLRRKFNEVLTDLLEIEQYMHVMTIPNMDEAKYFDNGSALTEMGKKQFWVSLNDQFKSFKYHALDDSTIQPKTHCGDSEYVRNTKKLPTPPPKSQVIVPAKSRLWTTKKISSSHNGNRLHKNRNENRRGDHRYSEERDRSRDNYRRRHFDNY